MSENHRGHDQVDLGGPPKAVGGSFPLWQKALLFGVAYCVCAQASFYLSAPGSPFIAIWLPAGLYVAVLLLNDRRDWPWLVLAILPANLAFDIWHGTRLVIILVFYCANTSEAVLGAWLIHRFVAKRPTLATLKEFIGLVGFSAVLSTMLGATISAGMLTLLGASHSFTQSWVNWWTGEALAILLFSSFILTWFSRPQTGHPPSPNQGKRVLEASLLVVLSITLTGHLLFIDNGIMSPNKGPLWLPLLWAGLRFGPRGATATSLLLALPVAFFTTQHFAGLTPAQVSSGEYVPILQITLAMGTIAGLIPAIVLSERDETLEELRKSEAKFSRAFRTGPHSTTLTELATGLYIDVNEGFGKLFGYSREETVGHTSLELGIWGADGRARFLEVLRQRGAVRDAEFRMRHRNGREIVALVSSEFIELDGKTCLVSVAHDVTEHRQAETALRESERVLSTLLSNLPGLVYRCRNDVNWTMEFVSSGCRGLTGYAPEDLVANRRISYGQLIHVDDRQPVWDQVQAALQEQCPFELTYRIHAADGSEKWVWERGRGIFSPDGALQALEGFVTDITARRRAESERNAAMLREKLAREEFTRQLIASQEAERRRIAGELHDSLGQNLLLIKNRTQIALPLSGGSPEVREQLEGIRDVATQSINEVRQISHDLHPYQLQHLGLARALEAMLEKAAQSTKMVFEWKFDPLGDVLPLEAATNLYRVAQESLSNVIKHSDARHVRVNLERDVHQVWLRIEDDGRGFDAEQVLYGDVPAGLGLRNIIERVRILNGKIELDSRPGQGTKIRVEVPISAEITV